MAMTLITTNTSSDAATSDFTSGIDSTYKLYIFKFHNLNAASSDPEFMFQANVAGQSGFNETVNSTVFRAYHDEGDSTANLAYTTGQDEAEGTGYQCIVRNVQSGADNNASGELFLFNPSNTTYVKHFYATTVSDTEAQHVFTAGYFNVTGAIDEISFKMSSGNFDGTISLFGVG